VPTRGTRWARQNCNALVPCGLVHKTPLGRNRNEMFCLHYWLAVTIQTGGDKRNESGSGRAPEPTDASARIALMCDPSQVSTRRRTVEQVVAANLRELRLQAGLTQVELAARCGLHRTEISLLEREGREPRLSTLVIVARGLNVDVATLISGVDGAKLGPRQRRN
jgi:DNA-binding XRE family transcriptional regulator